MAGEKPNILVIWGDDIGITNLSAYSDGLMGRWTRLPSPALPRRTSCRARSSSPAHPGRSTCVT